MKNITSENENPDKSSKMLEQTTYNFQHETKQNTHDCEESIQNIEKMIKSQAPVNDYVETAKPSKPVRIQASIPSQPIFEKISHLQLIQKKLGIVDKDALDQIQVQSEQIPLKAFSKKNGMQDEKGGQKKFEKSTGYGKDMTITPNNFKNSQSQSLMNFNE